MKRYEDGIEGWDEADYIAEIEALRSQLALLAGAAAATVASGVPTGGLLDVLRACDRLHGLRAYQGMMALFEARHE